jgi:hypothetical protein
MPDILMPERQGRGEPGFIAEPDLIENGMSWFCINGERSMALYKNCVRSGFRTAGFIHHSPFTWSHQSSRNSTGIFLRNLPREMLVFT